MKKLLFISITLLSLFGLFSCGKSEGTATGSGSTFSLQGSGS